MTGGRKESSSGDSSFLLGHPHRMAGTGLLAGWSVLERLLFFTRAGLPPRRLLAPPTQRGRFSDSGITLVHKIDFTLIEMFVKQKGKN